MANLLQQLDLFGMPVETAPPAKPKKQPVKKTSVQSIEQSTTSLSENSIEANTDTTIEIEPTAISNFSSSETPVVFSAQSLADPVIYANDQIVVKVKKEKPAKTVKVPGKRGRKSFKEMDAGIDLIDIPTDEMLKQKLYYSISEVASWFKVNTSLLRYWENEFDILQPRKTRKGDRLFRVEDIKNLQLIYLLLRQRKFSIEGAKAYLKSNKNKIDTETLLVQTLGNFKKFLLELKSSLDR